LRGWLESRSEGNSLSHVTLPLGDNLPSLLGTARMDLGDSDDPMSSWSFGQRAEIFQYSFAGTHTVVSGWTCLCESSVVQLAMDGQLSAPSWKDFERIYAEQGGTSVLQQAAQHSGFPILFAGRLLDCPSASVFKYVKDSCVTGLMITNDFESIDD